ncbi:D-ribose pyranase [Peptostreptococcus equinus]|uniref:D-ribose pyranase n=1 Tax=Peptostreptococcus equinus TaxID=3003601 RepID=A0ABY7JSP8_9FIRM|nr:D-ribose pyranase [Peptostreptococcus sp. CBA3647]WAW14957.1 D-ribose pyranase [Peptostreptococcus sp. CBA3647]
MKKNGILNSDISKVLSDMGHTDKICICDCGLPIARDIEKIDLALELGVPSFQDVLKVVSEDMKVEKIILAKEIKDNNKNQLNLILDRFDKQVEIEFVSHEDFKKISNSTKAVIRTGEATPYSNIILQSGVIF